VVKTSDLHGNYYDVSVGQLVWRPSAYAIILKDGKILVSKQFGTYHLPGGAIEFGEMPEEAVVREVQEETGFVVSGPRLVDARSTFFTWKEGAHEWHFQSILLFYRCQFEGGKASIENMDETEKNDSEMPEWVPVGKLDKIAHGSNYDWLSIVRQALT
jgi:8-oxo-dGTP pyrophosphatase MutT (NUDIX family)